MAAAVIFALLAAACGWLAYGGHVLNHKQDAVMSALVSVLCAGGAVHAAIGAF